MSKIKNITIGADPELFLYSIIENRVISAEGLIGGTKDEPRPISENGHGLQEDNVMVEFTIPPAIDAGSFNRDIKYVLDYLEANIGSDKRLEIVGSTELDEEFLKTRQALEFGCDPDMCVWTGEMNDSPNPKTNLRTAGGHIHVGYKKPSMEANEAIVMAMDLFLGVPSILMDPDNRRREMYGNAGAFRPKDYGVEYRTLSNFWIASEELRTWAFNNTTKAVEAINNGLVVDEETCKKIKDCIDSSDKELAQELITEFNLNIISNPVMEAEYAK